MNSVLHKPFFFLRHGETNLNTKNIFTGITNSPLNIIGKKQAKEVSIKLKKHKINTIISSPLERTLKTSQIISNSIHKPIILFNEFIEVNFGKLERTKIIPNINSFIYDWENKKVDSKFEVESFDQVKKRINIGLNKAFKISLQPILIVSHYLVYHALCKLLQINFINIKNCQCIYHQPKGEFLTEWETNIV